MHAHHVPGLSLAVLDRAGVLVAGGYGAADLSDGAPATATTSYRWFSMTKPVTATAALRLADEGSLDLDAPVDEYVDLAGMALRGRRPTTRELLTHSAGLGNPLPLRWVHAVDRPGPDTAAFTSRLLGRRGAVRRPPGGAARYSNLGYLLAGQVIAAASGQPFEAYARTAILDPAGMSRTGFSHPADGSAATGYARTPRGTGPALRRLLPRGVVGDRYGKHLALRPFTVDGAAYGGLVGDVLDAARFMQMHLNDGELDGRRVIAPESARSMRRVDHKGRQFDHGIGWFRRPGTPAGAVEHLGTGAGFWNVIQLHPDEGIGIVLMANTTRPYDVDSLLALLARAAAS
jgi:CubicO group peptidase (beta-lactamase class C family)